MTSVFTTVSKPPTPKSFPVCPHTARPSAQRGMLLLCSGFSLQISLGQKQYGMNKTCAFLGGFLFFSASSQSSVDLPTCFSFASSISTLFFNVLIFTTARQCRTCWSFSPPPAFVGRELRHSSTKQITHGQQQTHGKAGQSS